MAEMGQSPRIAAAGALKAQKQTHALQQTITSSGGGLPAAEPSDGEEHKP
jgi:hypothetical protein